MRIRIWIKFTGIPPELWTCEHFEKFWYDFREHMLRNPNATMEWMIRD